MMQDCRNIEAWKFAHQLALRAYEMTQSFPKHEQYGLTNQLRRAASSIPTNIAEGCVRRTDADFARYLYHALGSASETEYLLLLSADLKYLPSDEYESMNEHAQRIKRMLIAFIRRLQQTNKQ